eukprot:gene9364-9527_t
MDVFLAEYKAELHKLQRNDKTQINTLSMLAEANQEFADGIVAAIEHHILSCPPPAKLPALYLIDSILKNVGGPYKASFSKRLHEAFGSVWDVTSQDKRTSLNKLYGTWANLLPADQAPTTYLQIGNNFVPVSALPTQPLVQPLMVQQQQQQTGLQLQQGPMLRRSPGSSSPLHADVGGYGPPVPPVGRIPAAPPRKASPLPSSAQLTSTALDNLLANLAKSGVLASAKDQEAAAIRTTEFQQAFLKELHPGVLKKLEADSANMRPKLRDLEFQRNKRKGAAAGAGVSRSWYLAVDLWISGTTAHDEAAVHNPFAEDDKAADASEQEDVQAMEPEDPDQVCCAISGEPFEKVYDQDAEGWFYRGVCRLIGDEAAKHGVPDGSLVKEDEQEEEDEDDFGLDEYAGLATGGSAMGTELKPALVKQEVEQEEVVKQQPDAEPVVATADLIGAKREAGSIVHENKLGGGEGLGSAAKRARLDDSE